MPANVVIVNSMERLDEVFEASRAHPVVLFKHSSSCGISAHLFEEIQHVEGEVNVVVVQDARHISDAIADRTGFRHHSPQAFVIRNEKAVYHASHYAIDPAAINSKLADE